MEVYGSDIEVEGFIERLSMFILRFMGFRYIQKEFGKIYIQEGFCFGDGC